jgi:hypothetical protein
MRLRLVSDAHCYQFQYCTYGVYVDVLLIIRYGDASSGLAVTNRSE